ncbi:MAG: hypothetical protein ACRD4P_14835, partial [Bryobacteraceae bacterium]
MSVARNDSVGRRGALALGVGSFAAIPHRLFGALLVLLTITTAVLFGATHGDETITGVETWT